MGEPGEGGAGRRWAPLRAFRTPLRGHAFAVPPEERAALDERAPVRLRREPGNPADPLAVAVWTEAGPEGSWRLGYLDRGVAARIAPRLDDGLELEGRLEGWVAEPRGRWLRPLLRLEPPTPEPLEPRSDAATTAPAPRRLPRLPGVERRVLGRRSGSRRGGVR